MSAELVKVHEDDTVRLYVDGRVVLTIPNWNNLGVFHNMNEHQIEAINLIIQSVYFNTRSTLLVSQLIGEIPPCK